MVVRESRAGELSRSVLQGVYAPLAHWRDCRAPRSV